MIHNAIVFYSLNAENDDVGYLNLCNAEESRLSKLIDANGVTAAEKEMSFGKKYLN